MAEEHRVASHLGVAADDYDRTIREFIPHYDRMLATVVHWLEGHIPAGGLVVDLGAGPEVCRPRFSTDFRQSESSSSTSTRTCSTWPHCGARITSVATS